MTDRGLFIGRFQPMHLGHLDAVKRLAARHDELLVAVGSANVSHTPVNPFTGGERVAMIHAALREAALPNVLALPLPDVGRNAVWVSHVASLVPRFRAVYTNNPLPSRLFREAGYAVHPAPFHERERYEGTRIRRMMREGDETWQDLVPYGVARVLKEERLLERLRDLGHPDAKVEGHDPDL